MTALIPMTDVERMAQAVAASGLFGLKAPQQALALMLVAQAEGLHPATVAQDYDIIQGRAARKTHSVLARFQAAGGSVQWHELTDQIAEATFSHPAGGSLRMAWTFAQAQKAGLTNKDNWRNYPRAMLRARCIAEGVRAVYPAAIGGSLVAEEAQDLPARPAGPVIAPAAVEMVEEVLSFAEIMARIDAAQSVDELNALKPAIRQLDRDIRPEATDAAKERAAEIRAAAEPAQTRAGATESAQEATNDPV